LITIGSRSAAEAVATKVAAAAAADAKENLMMAGRGISRFFATTSASMSWGIEKAFGTTETKGKRQQTRAKTED
jgi:hypothetical protein